MTSIKKIPSVLGTRRANTLEQERDHFERSQEASFRKAVNDEEVPVKMKHVRNLIIGTFTDKSADLFWRNVALNPPINTDVTAWKFCHCLHVVFRDGHPNVLRDSQRHVNRIKDTGQHFRHLTHGYGRLIRFYCDLLVTKLNFHQRYPRFPGALTVTPEELEALAENDANNYFELAVEMLEYMECILNLYEAVFSSMDPSRANSMTRSGQCRLAPLIPSIQDSSCLYDCIVRILFQLHKAYILMCWLCEGMYSLGQMKSMHHIQHEPSQVFSTSVSGCLDSECVEGITPDDYSIDITFLLFGTVSVFVMSYTCQIPVLTLALLTVLMIMSYKACQLHDSSSSSSNLTYQGWRTPAKEEDAIAEDFYSMIDGDDGSEHKEFCIY
nr:huntingtin-interacting protein 1-related protein-like [Penaeus vannamei]